MPFDLELLKKHPYATGGIVIIGGIIVFYLLSSSQGSASQVQTVAAGGADPNLIAADEQLAQVQAGAQVQTNAQQVALAQAQLEAGVANNQTAASLSATQLQTAAQLATALSTNQTNLAGAQISANAATAEQANQLVYAENLQGMQDQVLESQINSGVLENANNNATELAGLENNNSTGVQIAQLQTGIASQALTDATQLQSQQETAYDSQIPYIVQHAGEQKNSALDATDQTTLFQTILAGGNPAVAVSGNNATTTATVSGNSSSVAKLGVITNGITSVANNVVQGLFG